MTRKVWGLLNFAVGVTSFTVNPSQRSAPEAVS